MPLNETIVAQTFQNNSIWSHSHCVMRQMISPNLVTLPSDKRWNKKGKNRQNYRYPRVRIKMFKCQDKLFLFLLLMFLLLLSGCCSCCSRRYRCRCWCRCLCCSCCCFLMVYLSVWYTILPICCFVPLLFCCKKAADLHYCLVVIGVDVVAIALVVVVAIFK